VGDGPQRRYLRKLTRARGLSENVLWVGPLSHQEVVKHMAVCHVFALPSLYEGFARVLMEAGMAGMPIVTTAVSGSDDAVVHGKNGYIVPVGDSIAFSNALSELLHHPERALEMGRASRIHIQELVDRYSDSRMQVRIWTDVLSRRRQRNSG
jgi:glycosyltransferase involved in cell wall biosynthesis